MSVYGKQYSYNGETHYLSEWARITGISIYTLHKRVGDYGWPVERAFTEKPNRNREKVRYGKRSYTYSELSRLSPIGISPGTLRDRIVKRHMSIHDALTTPSQKEGHTTNALKKDRMAKDCCYPNCDNCPYDDCMS